MAIFRVEKTRDYTVMSNHHLKDLNISLKAKGLLTIMLSLPDTWNYTIRGLAAICREGVGAISTGIHELERAGYIVRRQIRGEGGRIVDTEYTIYECPVAPDEPDDLSPVPAPDDPEQAPAGRESSPPKTQAAPCPKAGNSRNAALSAARGREKHGSQKTVGAQWVAPHPDFSDMAVAYVEKPAELNTNQSNTNQSFFQEGKERRAVLEERARIRAQIEYDTICTVENRERVDELVELMLEALFCESPHMNLGRGRRYRTAFVQDRFSQINSAHIERILDALQENPTRVHNTRAYLLSTLLSAPATMINHYDMKVCSA